MDFEITEEQKAIYSVAQEFGESQIAPFARKWEEEGTIPKSLWKEMRGLGFGGICSSEQFGGTGLNRTDAILVYEALARSCPSVAAFLSIHNMGSWMIDNFGNDELKNKYLPKVNQLECLVSYCLTEPGSGSDASALKSKAKINNGHWVLDGTKSFISGGNYSDAYIVMCRTGSEKAKGISAIIVDANSQGLSFGANENKMGWRSQPTSELRFEECIVPQLNLLGEIGKGFKYAMMGLDTGRLNIAACSLGGAQKTFDQSVAYIGTRKAFGKTLDQFQALQFQIADMKTALETSRQLLRFAAWNYDQKNSSATKYCAMAKQYVTDTCWNVANTCLQLHGGYGYLSDYGIEKIVRDLRVHQILEGTNEIMRTIIFRETMREYQ